jgi:N,N-dimethylformamidase
VVPLVGYLDRFSARPGERVEVKVSSTSAEPYRADLVRIIHGDANPAGPGIKLAELPAAFAASYPSRFQPVHLGSCGVVVGSLALPDPCTIVVRVQPWLLDGRVQTVLATDSGLALSVAAEGAYLDIAGNRAQIAAPMLERRWYELRVLIAGGQVRLRQTPLQQSWGVADRGEAEVSGSLGEIGRAVFGAAMTTSPGPTDNPHCAFFNGRIEDPAFLAGLHDDPAPIDAASADCLACWDFSLGIPTLDIGDRGPHGLHGTLLNLPVRGMPGSRWTGAETNWRHAPRDYAAIHFHEDDLYDCGWATDFAVEIPEGMQSGVYGIRLRGGGAEDIVPFYVLPPKGAAARSKPLAFLASTFTYQIYGNHRRGNTNAEFHDRQTAWGAYPSNADQHPEYAASTYNVHVDGSGVCYSSQRRPLLTMRPGYITYLDRRGSGLRHFPADTHLVDWLTVKGAEFDIVTDHDLDREGTTLLEPYRAVVTGSHPEYHTPNTLDAIRDYIGGGGRLAYLGGNGFYWRIGNSAAVPDVVEVRRAEGGIRAWAAEPGEYFHALDGGYGGLWRRNGRPPQMLCGVGFSAQGLFEGSYYRKMPDAANPRAAWIFDGIDGDIIGDFGLSGGGAAGFELDRADFKLGTPPNALILARSEGHQAHFVTVPEELLTHVMTITGERPKALIRAEIVYFETTAGGAVFSTGSITFCGSLSHDDHTNNVSRLLENVLARFTRAD